MLLEVHAHTARHSPCSNAEPVALVKRIIEKGLQAFVSYITHYEIAYFKGISSC